MGLIALNNDSIIKWKRAFRCSSSVKTVTVTNINQVNKVWFSFSAKLPATYSVYCIIINIKVHLINQSNYLSPNNYYKAKWVQLTISIVFYYSTIMSFYHISSRERVKYETVLHCRTEQIRTGLEFSMNEIVLTRYKAREFSLS